MKPGKKNTFNSLKDISIDGEKYKYYSILEAEKNGLEGVSRLPKSIKVLLENLLRYEDDLTVNQSQILAIKEWLKNKKSSTEIAYRPARVLLQDYTGIPAVADLAAMREAVKEKNKDPNKINPLSAVDLVIDHSVQVDKFANSKALKDNVDIEFNGIEKTNLFEDTNIDLKNTFTGCITFENVEFKNVSIISKQGKCEDSINFINSSGEINLIKSYNAFSDAIDFDFSNIVINKIIVEDAINDCLDLSYGKYEINYMKLEGCGDKALSIGESSKLINEIVKISNSNFGISTKDSSYSNFNFVEIENVNTCISSYNKKQEFDGAISKINNIKCNNFQLDYYYDDMSKIQIISEELSKGIKSK